jgi:hypothetical protein
MALLAPLAPPKLLWIKRRLNAIWQSRHHLPFAHRGAQKGGEDNSIPAKKLTVSVYIPGYAALLISAALFPAPSGAMAQDRPLTIARPDFGCRDWDVFNKIVVYIAQKDDAAFSKALRLGLSSGQCTAFRPGETVYVAESGLFSVKLRRKGDLAEFWTFREAATR